jgi:hypothetical protein
MAAEQTIAAKIRRRPGSSSNFSIVTLPPAAPVVRREPLLLKLFFTGRLDPTGLGTVLQSELTAVEAELAEFKAILGSIERDRADVIGQLGEGEAADAYRRVLVGPLITLTNGLRLGLAYRDWLRELGEAQDRGTLTDTAMLAELHRLVDQVGEHPELPPTH